MTYIRSRDTWGIFLKVFLRESCSLTTLAAWLLFKWANDTPNTHTHSVIVYKKCTMAGVQMVSDWLWAVNAIVQYCKVDKKMIIFHNHILTYIYIGIVNHLGVGASRIIFIRMFSQCLREFGGGGLQYQGWLLQRIFW